MPAFGSISSTTWAVRTNTTITAPSGIADGDRLVLIQLTGTSGEAPDPSPPAGFSLLSGPSWPVEVTEFAFNIEARVYEKTAASESGDYTVTHANCESQGVIVRVTSPGAFNPAMSSNIGTGFTTTATGLTVAANTYVMFVAWDFLQSGNDITAPTGSTPTFTERLDGGTSDLYVADGVYVAGGATGDKTITNRNTDPIAPWGGLLIAVEPAGGVDAGHTVDQSDLAALFARHRRQLPVWQGSWGAEAAVGANAPAEVAAAVLAALQAVISIAANAGLGAATSVAQTPTAVVRPSAGNAAATGVAQSPTVSIRVNAGVAAAVATSPTATASDGVNTGLASATGAALDPTVSTAVQTNAPAGVAAATGVANGPTVSIRPNAGLAAATGVAQTPTSRLASSAGLAAATAAANTAIVAVRPSAGVGTATGTANTAIASVKPNAGATAVSGVAHQPTVSTAAQSNASAGLAAATATANSATVRISPVAGLAAGIAIAQAATASVKPSAGVATVVGVAHDATTVIGAVIIGGHGVGGLVWRDGGGGTVTGRDVTLAAVVPRDNATGGVTNRDVTLATVGAAHTGTGTVQQP